MNVPPRLPLTLALVALACPSARADDVWTAKTAELVWNVRGDAVRCAEPHMIAAVVEDRIGRPVFATGSPTLVVTIDVRADAGLWRGTVKVEDKATPSTGRPPTRRFDVSPDDCSALRAVLVDAVTIAVDADPTKRATLDSGDEPVPASWEVAVGLGAVMTGATTPFPAFGGVLRAAVHRPGIVPRLELGVGATAPKQSTGNGLGADVSTMFVEIAACPTLIGSPEHPAALRLCAGFGVDRVRVSPDGGISPQTVEWNPRLDAGVSLSVKIGAGFAVNLLARVDVPLSRHRFVADSGGTPVQVWHTPAIGGSGQLLLERAFP